MAIEYRAVGFPMSLFHRNRSSKPSRIRRGADVALFDDLRREPPENNRKHMKTLITVFKAIGLRAYRPFIILAKISLNSTSG